MTRRFNHLPPSSPKGNDLFTLMFHENKLHQNPQNHPSVIHTNWKMTWILTHTVSACTSTGKWWVMVNQLYAEWGLMRWYEIIALLLYDWRGRLRVIGLLLQSLQHISARPDHDAGMAEGGFMHFGIRGSVGGKSRGLGQWWGTCTHHPALSQLDRISGWRVRNGKRHVG